MRQVHVRTLYLKSHVINSQTHWMLICAKSFVQNNWPFLFLIRGKTPDWRSPYLYQVWREIGLLSFLLFLNTSEDSRQSGREDITHSNFLRIKFFNVSLKVIQYSYSTFLFNAIFISIPSMFWERSIIMSSTLLL